MKLQSLLALSLSAALASFDPKLGGITLICSGALIVFLAKCESDKNERITEARMFAEVEQYKARQKS